MNARKIKVAAVQMACELGATERNLARASQWVEEAASQGARLVLLPELMPSGYTLTEALWDNAEPFDGVTTRWLKNLSRRFNLYIGTSFLEVEGDDFYNSFTLSSPAGDIAGRVRKNPPASFEAYFFGQAMTRTGSILNLAGLASVFVTKMRSTSAIANCMQPASTSFYVLFRGHHSKQNSRSDSAMPTCSMQRFVTARPRRPDSWAYPLSWRTKSGAWSQNCPPVFHRRM